MMSPFFYFIYKLLINILHAVGCQFCRVRRIQITRRNDNIRIYVIAVFKYCSVCFHSLTSYNPSSAGAEIFPVTALAAATAGLARYTSDSTCPILPTKLRFVVDIHLSPSARIPI